MNFFVFRKLLLKDLKMDAEGGGSDDLDKDLDLDLEFPATFQPFQG